MGKEIKLHLGCGQDILPGWINVDLRPTPGVDVIVDLNRHRYALKEDGEIKTYQQFWPFRNASVDAILAEDLFEYLAQPPWIFKQCWDVLKMGGTLEFMVPLSDIGSAGFATMEQKSYWTIESCSRLMDKEYGSSYGFAFKALPGAGSIGAYKNAHDAFFLQSKGVKIPL